MVAAEMEEGVVLGPSRRIFGEGLEERGRRVSKTWYSVGLVGFDLCVGMHGRKQDAAPKWSSRSSGSFRSLGSPIVKVPFSPLH